MKYFVSGTAGLGITMLFFSNLYGETDWINQLLILSTQILLLLLLIKKIRKTKSSYAFIAVYSVAVFIYTMIGLRSHIHIDAFSATIIVYFIIQIFFAVYSSKADQNSTFGIRTPFTLDYKEVWDKTHVFMSVAETLTLPMLFALIFYAYGTLRFFSGTVIVVLPLVCSALYSNVIGVKYHKTAIIKENEELKKQEEAEECLHRCKTFTN